MGKKKSRLQRIQRNQQRGRIDSRKTNSLGAWVSLLVFGVGVVSAIDTFDQSQEGKPELPPAAEDLVFNPETGAYGPDAV